MSKRIGIYPSIMCSKPWEIKDYIKVFEKVGVDAIHFDVMDGHFVPNITLGTGDFEVIRTLSDLPIDAHFMVEEPEKIIPYFNLKENDLCSFHPETTRQPYRLLQSLRNKNIKAGLAISPGTSVDYIENCLEVLDFILVMAVNPGFAGQKMVPDHLKKLAKIKEVTDKAAHKIEIIVDGNTTVPNSISMLEAGADSFVVGTSSMMKYGPEKFEESYKLYLDEISI
ncbi:MAG: ribulose-phosphate 3-epimerase [Erysipelotrichaceae bacterium]|jgi:ribulose-phosphate 3-epimerase